MMLRLRVGGKMYKGGCVQMFLQRLSEMDFIHFVLNSVRSWLDFRSALRFKEIV